MKGQDDYPRQEKRPVALGELIVITGPDQATTGDKLGAAGLGPFQQGAAEYKTDCDVAVPTASGIDTIGEGQWSILGHWGHCFCERTGRLAINLHSGTVDGPDGGEAWRFFLLPGKWERKPDQVADLMIPADLCAKSERHTHTLGDNAQGSTVYGMRLVIPLGPDPFDSILDVRPGKLVTLETDVSVYGKPPLWRVLDYSVTYGGSMVGVATQIELVLAPLDWAEPEQVQ